MAQNHDGAIFLFWCSCRGIAYQEHFGPGKWQHIMWPGSVKYNSVFAFNFFKPFFGIPGVWFK
jgi:hypothetical protein